MLAAAVAVTVATVLVWGFFASHDEAANVADSERPIKAPLRVSAKNGEPVITLDPETQQRSGIATETLRSTPHQQHVRAYGMVLDVARLTDLSNNYVTAKAQVQTAQAKLAMSRPAFERAKTLYDDHKAVSEAQMQSAQAAMATDEANLAVAMVRVRTLSATAYQEWGSVLGKSLVEESPMIARLIERQDVLLQITLMPGTSLPTPPATAALEIGNGARAAIAFVSPATRIDPKIQGVSFFYTAPAQSGLLPGRNVLAFLPTGKSVTGVTVPATAIVWWQDRAWLYRRITPSTFTRVEIATDLPAPDGGYIVKDMPSDADVVTRGAQLLLSEEFRAQIQVDEND